MCAKLETEMCFYLAQIQHCGSLNAYASGSSSCQENDIFKVIYGFKAHTRMGT